MMCFEIELSRHRFYFTPSKRFNEAENDAIQESVAKAFEYSNIPNL